MRNTGSFGTPPGIRSFVSFTKGSNPTNKLVKWAQVDTFGDKVGVGLYSTGEQYAQIVESGVYCLHATYNLTTTNGIAIVKDVTDGTTLPADCHVPHESGPRALAQASIPQNNFYAHMKVVCWLPANTRIAVMALATSGATTNQQFLRVIYLGP